jgi:hypothetical protein
MIKRIHYFFSTSHLFVKTKRAILTSHFSTTGDDRKQDSAARKRKSAGRSNVRDDDEKSDSNLYLVYSYFVFLGSVWCLGDYCWVGLGFHLSVCTSTTNVIDDRCIHYMLATLYRFFLMSICYTLP